MRVFKRIAFVSVAMVRDASQCFKYWNERLDNFYDTKSYLLCTSFGFLFHLNFEFCTDYYSIDRFILSYFALLLGIEDYANKTGILVVQAINFL